MNITTIGLDIAKNVFQVHGVDRNGKAVLRKKVSRGKVIECFAKLPVCLIGMEACAGAHHWAREVMKLGHSVKLMPAQYVKAYLKGQKTDGNDAEAICEAVSRPGMRFVAINREAQQDLQMLHRIRHRLVGERTALINQIRGLLGEYGIVFAQGPGRYAEVWSGYWGTTRQGCPGSPWSFCLTCTSSCGSSTNGLPVMMHGYNGPVPRMNPAVSSMPYRAWAP
jgi:transposase